MGCQVRVIKLKTRLISVTVNRPSPPCDADQGGERAGPARWHVAVAGRQVGVVGEAAADEQVVVGAGGGQPRPPVVPLALGPRCGSRWLEYRPSADWLPDPDRMEARQLA